MQVSLIKTTRIFSLVLPQTINGAYWITDIDANGLPRKLLSIEASEGGWVLNNTQIASATPLGSEETIAILKPSSFYNVKINGECEKVLLFVEEATKDREIYDKYVVLNPCSLSIGRQNCNITYDNAYTSSYHATLSFDGKNWCIQDNQSTNGTYVNGFRVDNQVLYPGDVIFILGMKIIVGNSFIAVNDPDGKVIINDKSLMPYIKQENHDISECSLPAKQYFYRSPRFKRDVSNVKITIDSPPQSQVREDVPIAMVIGPSITMGLGSVSMAFFSIINTVSTGRSIMNALPTVVMSFFMLVGMILWPILTRNLNEKKSRKNEEKRQEKYRAYLSSVNDDIVKECAKQADILNENGISLKECENRILNGSPKLWERMISHDDFLNIKVGMGNLKADITVECQRKKFTMDEDNLQDDMLALAGTPIILQSVPITISLKKDNIIGFVGSNYKEIQSYTKDSVIQIAALHSYDELKIVYVGDEFNSDEWEFMKWLPHCWDNEKQVRYVIETISDFKEIIGILEKEYDERVNQVGGASRVPVFVPYYLIIINSSKTAKKCELINKMLNATTNVGFSLLYVCNIRSELPKETSMVVELNDGKAKLYNKNDLSGNIIEFDKNPTISTSYDVLAKKMLNTTLDLSKDLYTLPNMLDFLSMFNVGKIEQLNPFERWKYNDPTLSLRAPVGVNTSGDIFMLDLHEKFQGPHGLVAGMTGSGKSEFIITYILSMAVNYHPDEVAFILIDYKGGGLAGAFEDPEKGIKLPHLAGTITNLDGAAVKRSLISIQSELRRRQAVFNEARKLSNEGTIDIYKYQKLYRQGVVKEPVPHLFIISDEFAELKTQQPEFMEQLTSAARIGRSLGVHLILATQKPNGVVDDQIWSNSRFRVCLKVQDRADSNDMIKRPDAAEISNTGRFYLQVGFNEYFDMGQSAWCGAPYVPEDTVKDHVDDNIEIIDMIGHVLSSSPAKKVEKAKSTSKQVVAIVKYLSDIAKKESISVRPLWMKEIPKFIKIDDIREKYNVEYPERFVLNPLIGELDDPFNQRQLEVRMPLSLEGNAAVYAASGGGKSSFITTMMYELILHHTAEELNAYIVDCGAETLKMFEKAPQVGDVILSSDTERVVNLFKMIKKEITYRKKLFSEYGGDYESYCKRSDSKVPNILVVIHNYAGFAENYEYLEDTVAYCTRECTKYGIHFVITASAPNAIKFRILQNIKLLYPLQLNDNMDYVSILGSTHGMYPSSSRGRGLLKGDEIYEFQVAMVDKDDCIQDTVLSLCSRLRDEYKGHGAKKVPIMPKKVDMEFLSDTDYSLSKVPVGIDKSSLDIVYHDYQNRCLSLILGQVYEEVICTAQALAEIISRLEDVDVCVIDSNGDYAEDSEKNYTYIDSEFENEVVQMFNLLVERNNGFKRTKDNSTYKHKIYIINSIVDLMSKLTQDGREKLEILIEKTEKEYNVHFIISEHLPKMPQISMTAWFKKHFLITDGIWLGNGFVDQYILKLNRTPSELYKGIEDWQSLDVTKGNYHLMKAIQSVTKNVDEDMY
ncbi:MAG: type VII secretion protein EssC [Eubacteriales bacterium]|nr:type VII secretion protein EssC [Eubacteriales bacterium]